MEYIIEASHLEKKYRKFKAIDDLSIHIEKGSIYGLIGKNGAGKTTLLRLLCGLQKPTAGTYSIFGISNKNRNITEARKKVGAVIECPALCFDMTAEDNLKEQYKIIGLSNYDNLYQLLKLVKLSDTGKKIVKNFSLGMKQRLSLAIALIGSPDVLILDEPINGLDPEGIIEMRELILRLNKEKEITFLISSHYLDELSKISTHYGFMNNHRIVKEIKKEELEKDYKRKIQINVNNVNICTKYLEKNNIPYKIISNNVIDIYVKMHVSELVLPLSKINCTVNNFQEIGESLEDYYLNLIGGTSNE
ncbi:MAG: ATP-binding cassette domain-containing protein [Clostridia bacterium]|nr:ATP-binding cassette domain-containing protein [Clostridia bacterium]